MTKHTFQVGDLVRLQSGWTAKEVANIVTEMALRAVRSTYAIEYERYSPSGTYLVTRYLRAEDEGYNDPRVLRRVEDFVPWDGDPLTPSQLANCTHHQPEQEDIMSKLYQTTTEPVRFGTFLATNSEGLIVLEMKGEGGKVEAFEKDKLEEVKPYTVRCAHITERNGSGNSTLRNYETVKGLVAKGDFILRENGDILRVTALDTKAEKTCGTLKGRKLVTELIGVEDNTEESE